MDGLKRLTPFLSVSPQISEADIGALAARGFRAVVNNRPDGEGDNQPPSEVIAAAARRVGMEYRHRPVVSGKVTDADVDGFTELMGELRGPVVAFCRTGTRSITLWALSEAWHLDPETILETAAAAGYDLSGLRPRLEARWRTGQLARGTDEPADSLRPGSSFDVLVVGGGAAGCAAAASILKRRPHLAVAIVEPRDVHYYQPGWTLVGGGAFLREETERPMAAVMPKGVKWIRAACAAFEPEHHRIVLEDGERVGYRTLVVAPGLKLDWDQVEGLRDALGHNGVTSNYLFDLAPYTWELVQSMRGGTALFTQPPMPIKCAGAPQKAMYLSCDAWLRRGVLKDIHVEFDTAGTALFGVAAYVPTLMRYVERYGANLCFGSTLKAVDGPRKTAWFDVARPDGGADRVEKRFDMLHAVPPQTAPDFVRQSPLANAAGWVEVDNETLRSTKYGNVFALGDVCSAPNAKTAAAVRKQAPVVAENLLATLDGKGARAVYDGYGSCPLTVERGRVVLAEFGYGGKLLPSFRWDSTVARRSAWYLKTKLMPAIYFDMMLRGREWLAEPRLIPHDPQPHEAQPACDFGKVAAGGTPPKVAGE